jgi:hypothetical protein
MMTDVSSLRAAADALRDSRRKLLRTASALQKQATRREAAAAQMALEIAGLEEMLARRTGNPEPFP